jgi:hypothetical protein
LVPGAGIEEGGRRGAEAKGGEEVKVQVVFAPSWHGPSAGLRSFLYTAAGQPRIRTTFPLTTLTDSSVGEPIVITLYGVVWC